MVKLYIKKNDYGEYEVVWNEHGRKDESKTAYSDSLMDAQLTYLDTLRRALEQGIPIEEQRNKFTPMVESERGKPWGYLGEV